MRDEGLKEFLPTLKCLVELPSAGNQAGRFLRYRGPPGDGSDGSARATATDYGGGRSGDGCRPRAVLLAPRPWDFPSHHYDQHQGDAPLSGGAPARLAQVEAQCDAADAALLSCAATLS